MYTSLLPELRQSIIQDSLNNIFYPQLPQIGVRLKEQFINITTASKQMIKPVRIPRR